MFERINFDDRFADYTARWVQEHRGEYRTVDAMEEDLPRIYLSFLNEPADWLDGVTPGAYFTQFEDPKDLVDWLRAYCDDNVPVPELLLEQIESVGKPCEKRLVALLKDEEAGNDARMTAIGLLRSLESTLPKMLYIDWQIHRQERDELADNALDSLREMGKSAVQPMLEALSKANDAGQRALLDVLVEYPGNEQVLKVTLRQLREHPEKSAVLAGYLAKLGDERALPELQAAAQRDDVRYIDYIELRNAIEALGGEAPERDFSDDPDADALAGL